MYNNFDSFIESVLGGANGLPKQASTVPVASQQYTTAPALTVEQAEQIARTQLSAEETAMAEMLGQMEAENTVKQASFINGLGGQQMNYGQYLVELEKSASIYGATKEERLANVMESMKNTHAARAAGVNPLDLLENQHISRSTPNFTPAELESYKALQALEGEATTVANNKAFKAKSAPLSRAQKVKGAVTQHLIDLGASTRLLGLGAGGKAHAALGAGVYGAGALAAAGAGLGAKRIAAARRAARAPVEQSIGRAVLNHLGRHKGKYALGGAAALGLGGLMASKSASVDDLLWEKAASDGEAFLDQLAGAALSDATAQELQLFRAAALEAAGY